MRKRALGKTGLLVSEMALGTWGLSGDGYGETDPAEADRVLARALDVGVNLVDTADAYGGGRMELALGKALASKRDVVVVTKGGTDRTSSPPRKRFDAPYLRASIERSLRRLGREVIDVYLLHNPSVECLNLGEALHAVEEAKKDGLIAHWGVSAGDAAVAKVALDCGAEVISLPYNLLHGIDLHRVGGDLMLAGAGVLAHSTLAYGLLTGLWAKDRAFAEGDHRNDRWTRLELERRVGHLDAVRFLVKGDVHTLRGAAVRYVLANALVTSAILGPRTVTQLEQLIRETGAGPTYLSDADLAAIPRALAKIGVIV